jgi:hypothetical protein
MNGYHGVGKSGAGITPIRWIDIGLVEPLRRFQGVGHRILLGPRGRKRPNRYG